MEKNLLTLRSPCPDSWAAQMIAETFRADFTAVLETCRSLLFDKKLHSSCNPRQLDGRISVHDTLDVA